MKNPRLHILLPWFKWEVCLVTQTLLLPLKTRLNEAILRRIFNKVGILRLYSLNWHTRDMNVKNILVWCRNETNANNHYIIYHILVVRTFPL